VIGNSIGGWIASEMALLGSDRIGRLVLVDAVGIEVAGHPVVDFFSLTLDDVARLSYHDPDRFRIDPAVMSEAQRQVMAGNRAALAVYGGAMTDPTLRERLGGVGVATLVLWGEADRIVDPDYGRAFAAAIPEARFRLLARTGHVPQIETPRQLLTAIREFTARVAIVGPDDAEVALSGPILMRILEDGTNTGHRLGIGEITIAPHTDGPPQHRHAQHDEGFYVVSGTARFTVGHDSHDVGAGTLVMVPPGAPHTFANPGDEPAVLLNTFTPDLYVQYFRDLRDMIAAGRPMTDEAVIEVMARYATEPATDVAP
jgi:mannose-6-phosphate isomerase-like protein (cupin superfamily)